MAHTHPPEPGHETGGPAPALVGQQPFGQAQGRGHRARAGPQELSHHRGQLPISPQFANEPLAVGLSEVITQECGDEHGHGRAHRHLEFEITQNRRAEDDVEVAMELDVTRADESVIKMADLLMPDVRS